MSARILFSLASVGSGVVFFFTLLFIVHMFNDINSFYDDALHDMEKFKLYSDKAWHDMITDLRESERAHLAERTKRQSEKNGCAAQLNSCSMGPPGPPGIMGEPGHDGIPGKKGADGKTAIMFSAKYDISRNCITCPAALPGPPGPEGPVGEVGPEGTKGPEGSPGKSGQPGQNGTPGDAGLPGTDGRPGELGAPGKSGEKRIGAPGSAGERGPAGSTGKAGPKGQSGTVGQNGPQGPTGKGGHDGGAGPDGQPGQPGTSGLPGTDAAYCPCPPRSAAVNTNTPEQSYNTVPRSASVVASAYPYRRAARIA